MTSNPEYRYKAAFFLIKADTNLHVGSGAENYGIIDNLIQRDAATGFPCINSSSLKGALREFFKHYCKPAGEEGNDMIIQHIFGNDKKMVEEDEEIASDAASKEEKPRAGAYRFLQADLLSMPARSDSKPFYNATCPWLLTNFTEQSAKFKKALQQDGFTPLVALCTNNNDAFHFGNGEVLIEIDEIELQSMSATTNLPEAIKWLGNDVAVVQNEQYVELVSDFHLPVIARNVLEDGKSANLWYEQVLPRETRLFFSVLYPSTDAHFETFKKCITTYPVQIGANASVGYGFCTISEITLKTIE